MKSFVEELGSSKCPHNGDCVLCEEHCEDKAASCEPPENEDEVSLE